MKIIHRVKKSGQYLIFVFFLFSPVLSFSGEVSLLPSELIQAIIDEVSGEITLQNEIMLAPYERIRSTEEYTQQFWESEYIMRRAEEYGLQEVHLHVYPSEVPLWQAETGELWLIKPEKKKLADIREIAASLAMYSQSADITAELVYMESADDPSDYQGLDVKGKIILTADEIKQVQRIGVKAKGALGVISYASFTPDKYIDTVGWQWGLRAEKEDLGDERLFGFSISRRSGKELKTLLLDGKEVLVQAKVKATFHPGRDEVISAVIPGRDLSEEEFVLAAHLFEDISKQGANDNNSGSACILEVGRCIAQLIEQGKIRPPRRTIRFLWVPEYSGTISYLEKNPEIMKKMICGINMDMVGCDLYKNNSPFHIYRTPYSLPSYINYVAENIMDYSVKTNRVSLDERPYATIVAPTGSRQNFMCWMDEFDSDSDSDVFNIRQVKVPMVFFCNWTDDFYHSSEDVPKNSDPTQLKRAAFMGIAIALTVANAEDEDALKIAADSMSRVRSRLALCEKKAYNLLGMSGKNETNRVYKKVVNLIEQNFLVELDGLASCALLAKDGKNILAFIDSLKEELAGEKDRSLQDLGRYYRLLCRLRAIEPGELTATDSEQRLSKLIPVVKTKLVWPSIKEGSKDLKIFAIRNAAYEAFNFIDGRRSLLEIVHALDAELIDIGGIAPDAVEEYFRALEKKGLIEFKESF